MPDKTIISHPYSYEVLEFIGDAVLDFCGKEILEKHLNRTNTNTINQKQESFARNSNLIKAAKKIDLKDLTINIDGKIGEKRNADFFEALIGAIYVDGKEEGFDRAYKFLYDNFKDELLNNAVSN